MVSTIKNEGRILDFLKEAYEASVFSIGASDPNPSVGALVVHPKSMKILGKGFSDIAGGSHAEVQAIAEAIENVGMEKLSECELYVTLEPCSHFGKTPPCTDLIIQSKIPRIIIGDQDPYDQVNGLGIQKLKEAGREVILAGKEQFAREKYYSLGPFLHKVRTGKPRIIVKWVQTANGHLAPEKGPSGIISSSVALQMVHRMRVLFRNVFVAPGTVALDEPRLNARVHRSFHFYSEQSHFFLLMLNRFNLLAPRNTRRHQLRRFFWLPRDMSKEAIERFQEKQEKLGGKFFFFSGNSLAAQNENNYSNEIFSQLNDFDALIEHPFLKNTNQIFIETGPSFLEYLWEKNSPDMMVAFVGKNETPDFINGKTAAPAMALKRKDFDFFYKAGYKLDLEYPLEKEDMFVFIR